CTSDTSFGVVAAFVEPASVSSAEASCRLGEICVGPTPRSQFGRWDRRRFVLVLKKPHSGRVVGAVNSKTTGIAAGPSLAVASGWTSSVVNFEPRGERFNAERFVNLARVVGNVAFDHKRYLADI